MSESEISNLDFPRNYKKRESPMNDWLNVIFKMMEDSTPMRRYTSISRGSLAFVETSAI